MLRIAVPWVPPAPGSGEQGWETSESRTSCRRPGGGVLRDQGIQSLTATPQVKNLPHSLEGLKGPGSVLMPSPRRGASRAHTRAHAKQKALERSLQSLNTKPKPCELAFSLRD